MRSEITKADALKAFGDKGQTYKCELISELEDAFDIMFESEDILHYGSYENGKAILRKYGVEI